MSSPESAQSTNRSRFTLRKPGIPRVYIMDLWSFIPYYVASLAEALSVQSWDVSLGSVRYHLNREYFRKRKIKTDPFLIDFGGRIKWRFLRRTVKSLEYVLNLLFLTIRLVIRRTDILHVEYFPFVERGSGIELLFLKFARALAIPIVYTVHNLTRQDAPNQNKNIFRQTYLAADALICHGEDTRQQLESQFGVPRRKIWVIPHGPLFAERPQTSCEEARRILGLPLDQTIVLSLGVISPYKGIPFLLDAWKEAIESGIRGRLTVAGTGEPGLLSEIIQRISANGLQSSVDLFLNYIPVEQLPLFYQAADILVYPYQAGTTSGALLTGMNYGKAIVATRLPFFVENLGSGETGILVNYGNTQELSTALCKLINRPEDRLRMGAAVRKRIESAVSWQQIAIETVKCYESVCNGRN